MILILLKNIFSKIKENNIKSPSIIIIGDVCKHRKNLIWFEKKPLFGKKIVVTRARKNSSSLVEKIYENGGEAVEIPTIDMILLLIIIVCFLKVYMGESVEVSLIPNRAFPFEVKSAEKQIAMWKARVAMCCDSCDRDS